jgi:hypothetical protein
VIVFPVKFPNSVKITFLFFLSLYVFVCLTHKRKKILQPRKSYQLVLYEYRLGPLQHYRLKHGTGMFINVVLGPGTLQYSTNSCTKVLLIQTSNITYLKNGIWPKKIISLISHSLKKIKSGSLYIYLRIYC